MSFFIFSLWMFVLIGRPQDYFHFLESFHPALVLALLTIVATVISGKFTINTIWKDRESRIYIFFYIFMILGIPFAYHRRIAFNFIFMSYIVNMFFYFVLINYMDSLERVKKIITIIVMCNIFYSVTGLISGSFIEERYYTYSHMFDPNDITYVLLSLFPVSIYFYFRKKLSLMKLIVIANVLASIAIVLFTGSRAGVICLVITLILLLVMFKNFFKFSHMVVVGAALIIVLALNIEKINIDRYQTLSNISSDYNLTSEGGRIKIWERGFQLFKENPVTGVGAGCFSMALGYFREGLNIQPVWQAAHNSYVQIAVETGFSGFIPYMILIAICLKDFFQIRKMKCHSSEIEELKMIAGLCQVAYMGLLINAFFISQGYSIILTMYIAFAVSFKKIFSNVTPALTVS